MATILSNTEISAILDQRGPMTMLDRVQINSDFSGATGVKCISMGHSCFQGHFPGAPILPGVLQVAALSQAAGVLLKQQPGAHADSIPLIEEIRKFKFRKPVMPGDLLRVDIQRDAEDPSLFHGRTYVNGDTASQGRLVVGLRPQSDLAFNGGELMNPWPELQGISATMEPVMTAEEIMHAIPHRFPFLLIDRVLLCDPETLRFVALKNVSATDSYFDYSSTPVLPRYLQAEMAAQAGCGMALSTPGQKDMLVYFMAIDKAVYHEHVYPGDQLLVDINISVRSRFGKAVGKLHVGSRTVADLELKFAMVERGTV